MNYSSEIICEITRVFDKKYIGKPDLIFSPGRVNLLGEHVDYNDGTVLPAAINKGIYLAFKRNYDKKIRLYSIDFDQEICIDSGQSKPINTLWANYIIGVVSILLEKRSDIGFDLVFKGDIPIGSGLSSSAALECGIGQVVKTLFLPELKDIEIIKACQKAEHQFVGVKCGIMDQFASYKGKKDHILQLDCSSLQFKYLPLALDKYQIILLNTKVKHSLADSSYNKRREECETGLKIIQSRYDSVHTFKDISAEMLYSLKKEIPANVYKRCLYVIHEIERVQSASIFLKKEEIEKFGILMFETHTGLSQDYEVSCPELDFLVDLASKHINIVGARMMGGGFGGCTINIIERTSIQRTLTSFKNLYRDQFNVELEVIEVEIENGTHNFSAHI